MAKKKVAGTRGQPPPHIIEEARKKGYVLASVAAEAVRIHPRNLQRAAAADPEFKRFKWTKYLRWLFVNLEQVKAAYPPWEEP